MLLAPAPPKSPGAGKQPRGGRDGVGEGWREQGLAWGHRQSSGRAGDELCATGVYENVSRKGPQEVLWHF